MKSKCERLSVYAQNIMSHDQSLVMMINLFLQFLTPISKATYFKQQLSRPVNSGIVDGEQYEHLYVVVHIVGVKIVMKIAAISK